MTDVAFAATAGHVLDFDLTFSAGVAHVSAATAPAALVLAAHLGLPLGNALDAYADGYEAMASLAASSHPRLYDGGWHPTSVCGPEQELSVIVHPRARQAAHLELVTDGLSAKFSIPYCVAFTLLHGPPRYRDFAAVDAASEQASRSVSVKLDQSLPEFGAVIIVDGQELARVPCPPGAPERPLVREQLTAKVADLAGDRLPELLELLADLDSPAAAALRAARLDRERSQLES